MPERGHSCKRFSQNSCSPCYFTRLVNYLQNYILVIFYSSIWSYVRRWFAPVFWILLVTNGTKWMKLIPPCINKKEITPSFLLLSDKWYYAYGTAEQSHFPIFLALVPHCSKACFVPFSVCFLTHLTYFFRLNQITSLHSLQLRNGEAGHISLCERLF